MAPVQGEFISHRRVVPLDPHTKQKGLVMPMAPQNFSDLICLRSHLRSYYRQATTMRHTPHTELVCRGGSQARRKTKRVMAIRVEEIAKPLAHESRVQSQLIQLQSWVTTSAWG